MNPRAVLALLLFLAGADVSAQVRGVVWSEPDEISQAATDFHTMVALGINAVRTAPIRNDLLYDLADSLGIALYQEIPIAYVPAGSLADTLEAASVLLADVLSKSEGHRSATHFGLAYAVGTNDPEACTYFTRLIARHGRPDWSFYYVTRFSEDACVDAVDLVLFDGSASVRSTTGVPTGLAAVGVSVDVDAPYGLRSPGSAARQARFFEDALSGDTRTLFVYRWRDGGSFQRAPLGRRYGLFDDAGFARPAAKVVQGAFRGGQAIFPYPAGPVNTGSRSWIVMVGWMLMLVVAVLFALSPRFGSMVPRYFVAHGFYRSAVEEGREGLIVANSLLLVVLGCVVGLMATLAVEQFVETGPYAAVHHWVGSSSDALDRLVLSPGLPMIAGGGAVVLVLSFWVTLWTIAVRRRRPLRADQAIMLTVWPRWTALLLLIATMVISTYPVGEARNAVLVLVGCWFLSAVWATIRTSLDLMQMRRIGPVAIIVLWVFNPMVILCATMVTLWILREPEVSFLWSLAIAGS